MAQTSNPKEGIVLYDGEDYQHDFDAKAYNELWYPGCDPANPDHEFAVIVMNILHQIFESGKYKGKRLLEICSGPTVHGVMSASKHYSEIYLTEYAEPNRTAIRQWLSRDPSAHDWSAFAQRVACLEGDSITAADVERRLRDRVKGVLACDLHEDKPLGPAQDSCTPADAVLSCYTLEVAVKEHQNLADFFKKFAAMLVPGGLLCVLGLEEMTYYLADKGRFYSARGFPEQLVRDSLDEAGFGDVTFRLIGGERCHYEYNDAKKYFVVSATRQQ